jgi:poly(3-hydroxybutyrate) depolymerase
MRIQWCIVLIVLMSVADRFACEAVCLGCNGNASPPSGNLSVSAAGVARTYTLVLPKGYDGKTAWPVVFAFHGTGSKASEFIGLGYGNVKKGVADRAILVAPDGLVRNGMTGWASFSGASVIEAVDFALFDSLIINLKANYCIDESKIFSMGHSAGAMISNQFAYERKVLRGIAPFSGGGPYTSSKIPSPGKVATFVGHNPYELTTATDSCQYAVPWKSTGWPTLKYWCKTNGCNDPSPMPTEPFSGTPPCSTYAGCDPNYPVVLCFYNYTDKWDCQHAFPTPWGAKAAVDFFLNLPQVSVAAKDNDQVLQTRSMQPAKLEMKPIAGGILFLLSHAAWDPAAGKASLMVVDAHGSVLTKCAVGTSGQVFWRTCTRKKTDGLYIVRAQLSNGSAITRSFALLRRD